MMKCVFALVLLHLCHSATLDFGLNSEMIANLDKLNRFCKVNKVNFISPENVTVPGNYMTKNPASCIVVFRVEMRHLLDSLTVHKDAENTVKKLRGNLKALGQHAGGDTNCTTRRQDHKTAFQYYKKFLQRLNSR